MNQSNECRLGAYEVLRCIGKGSYGEVYLVTAEDTRKQYVMKNIKLTGSSAKERLGAEQEAALLSHLRHPNIVSYKESFQDDSGTLHIVMGFCEGGDLHSRLKTYRSVYLPETKVVEWFVQIALGLQYLHNRNILHRDLKTQNIFLSKNDIIKVGDLGIARVLDGSCDLAHTVIGTPYYMSPELFANQPYNHKSDIWALGCCVHEIASLKHTFSARNINALMYKVVQGKAPPIPSHYSKELVQMVQDMLAQKPERRPNVHEILRKEFIRKHIRMFLERASERKRKGKPPPSSDPTGEQRDIIKQAKMVSEVQISGFSSRPPPSSSPLSNDVVSSARQRRRRSKQQEGRARILKAREVSDETKVCADEADQRTNKAGDTEQREGCGDGDRDSTGDTEQKESCGDGDRGSAGDTEHEGCGDGDRGSAGDTEQKESCGDGDRDSAGDTELKESCGARDSAWDSPGDKQNSSSDAANSGDSVTKQAASIDGYLNASGHMFGEPDYTDGGPDQWNGRTDQDEVEDFFTLLDSTLQLSEAEVLPSSLTSPLDGIGGVSSPGKEDRARAQLPSGRLAERIKALRTECEHVLGPSVVHQVLELLSGADPEESLDDIKLAIGTGDFEVYSAKLQQLKLCQDSLFFSNHYS